MDLVYANTHGSAWADGTRVRYRNYDALASKEGLGRPPADRLSNEVLEDLGRRFVTDHLASLVTLGPGEELVPLFTDHEINGMQAVGPGAGPAVEQVTSSRIMFGRTIGGVSVIGPGSKVSVL